MKNGLRKISKYRTKISVEKSFRSFVLFTIKNVASGYNLCHIENCFIPLYVCFKIVTYTEQRSIPDKLKNGKKTPLNTKDIKSGTNRINIKMA